MSKDKQARPVAIRRDGKPDRFDMIEAADDMTERLNPHRSGAASDPMEDLLDGNESNADYKDEANQVTPTLGPSDETGNA